MSCVIVCHMGVQNAPSADPVWLTKSWLGRHWAYCVKAARGLQAILGVTSSSNSRIWRGLDAGECGGEPSLPTEMHLGLFYYWAEWI
jgi:hypothetical protein